MALNNNLSSDTLKEVIDANYAYEEYGKNINPNLPHGNLMLGV